MAEINVGKIKPIKGVDYWTAQERSDIIKDLEDFFKTPESIERYRGEPAEMTFDTPITGISVAEGGAVEITNIGTVTKPHLKITIPRGDKGEKGDIGEPFRIDKIYATIEALIADTPNVPPGKFAMINNSDLEYEYNGVLFYRELGASAGQPYEGWRYIANLSGVQGIQGPKGDKGNSGTMQVGTTTTLAPGASATVENVGSAENAILNFGIPQGLKGNTGTIHEVQVATGEAGTDAKVETSGDPSDLTIKFTIPRGDKGNTGTISSQAEAERISWAEQPRVENISTDPTEGKFKFYIPEGPIGVTPTVGVGTVESTEGNPEVTTTPIAGGVNLNFKLKKGDKGDTGAGFVIHGIVPTVADLPATGKDGDAWAVGTEESNVIYIWDTNSNSWKSIGPMGTSTDWSKIINKPDVFPPSTHSHNDLYYTETEIDSKIDTINASISTNTSAIAGHTENISSLNTRINQEVTNRTTAISTTKTDLEGQITTTKTTLEATDANLSSRIGVVETELPKKQSALTKGTDYLDVNQIKALNDLTNYYLKTDVYNKTEVDVMISTIPKFAIQVVDELPALNKASLTTIYLLRSTIPSGQKVFDEYVCVITYTLQQKTDPEAEEYIDETIFNAAKTLYAIKIGEEYQDCTESSIYDATQDYYKNRKWEIIGNQVIDLTGYAKESWVLEKDYATNTDLSTATSRITTLESETAITKILSNYTVPTSGWTADSTYTDFPYSHMITFNGCTADYYPEVTFNISSAMNSMAPVAVSGANCIYIYSKIQPTVAVPISVVKIWKLR